MAIESPSQRHPSGQAITEYVFLLLIVVAAFTAIAQQLGKSGVQRKFTSILTEDFRRAYQYGNKTAHGYEDPGGPQNHPRVNDDKADNFRIFIRPGINE